LQPGHKIKYINRALGPSVHARTHYTTHYAVRNMLGYLMPTVQQPAYNTPSPLRMPSAERATGNAYNTQPAGQRYGAVAMNAYNTQPVGQRYGAVAANAYNTQPAGQRYGAVAAKAYNTQPAGQRYGAVAMNAYNTQPVGQCYGAVAVMARREGDGGSVGAAGPGSEEWELVVTKPNEARLVRRAAASTGVCFVPLSTVVAIDKA
jgi:hypothetical protein